MALTTFVAGNVLTALQLNDSFDAVNLAKYISGAKIDTVQTTTSSSFTDLATAGPSVTVTTGTKALVIIGCGLYNGTVGAKAVMGFAISGATTTAASDAFVFNFQNPGGATNIVSTAASAFVVTVTAGSNTFTAKYKSSSGTSTFENRSIIVIPL
jgi:hypothetical protein